MAIALTGVGGVFTRLGKIVKAIRNANGYRGITAPSPSSAWGASGPTINALSTAINDIEGQFQSTNQHLITSLYTYRDSHRAALDALLSYLSSLSSTVLITMANDDAVLTAKDLTTAVKILISQMTTSSDSVNANATSVSVAAASGNTGNATVIASVKNGKGVAREYLYAEVIEAKVTGDAGTGSTAGVEPVGVYGEVAETNSLNWNWPDGSGASTTTAITNPEANASVNRLYNSSFELWGGVPTSNANMPSRWTVVTGTVGTHFLKNTGNLYSSRSTSTAALELVGDGSTLHSFYQKFNDSTNGTSLTLKPNTLYGVNVYMKRSAAMTGVVAISLVNSSNTVINDDAGTANTISKDLSTLGASYEAVSGWFITPKVLPSDYRIIIRGTTAIQNSRSLYLDDLALVEGKEIYTRGPTMAMFRGSTDVAKDDQWNITVSNDYGGFIQTYIAWSLLKLNTLDTSSFDVQLPSNAAGSETVADSLTL